MSEYPWNKKNNTFTWLSSLYNPFHGLRCGEEANNMYKTSKKSEYGKEF